jgi:hypothetical protein
MLDRLHNAILLEQSLSIRKSIIENEVRSNFHHFICLLHEPLPQTRTILLTQLNPVIGETLQGSYPDGTQIYC